MFPLLIMQFVQLLRLSSSCWWKKCGDTTSCSQDQKDKQANTEHQLYYIDNDQNQLSTQCNVLGHRPLSCILKACMLTRCSSESAKLFGLIQKNESVFSPVCAPSTFSLECKGRSENKKHTVNCCWTRQTPVQLVSMPKHQYHLKNPKPFLFTTLYLKRPTHIAKYRNIHIPFSMVCLVQSRSNATTMGQEH